MSGAELESLRPYGLAKLVIMSCLLIRGNYTTFEDLEHKSRKLANMFIADGAPQDTMEGVPVQPTTSPCCKPEAGQSA
jgi:hypothetical protein